MPGCESKLLFYPFPLMSHVKSSEGKAFQGHNLGSIRGKKNAIAIDVVGSNTDKVVGSSITCS